MPDPALPSGLYERLLTLELDELIGALNGLAEVGALSGAESPARLADHARRVLQRALEAPGLRDNQVAQVELVNRVIRLASAADAATKDTVAPGPRLLEAILEPGAGGLGRPLSPSRPTIPLSADSLLVNAKGDPSLSAELKHEIASADRIDLICAFVVWTGLRVILDDLQAARQRGVPVRVITTTYTGTTDARALNALHAMGAEVKVSYELGATRLHAKAWLFKRNSGFGTAYIGSSNLTHTAIHEGIEWNVRLTEHRSPALLDRFDAAFATYWASDQFELYDESKFTQAVAAARSQSTVSLSFLDVRPLDFQARMLERLRVERERFNRHRNLVVAATGTGKTVMAALDYQRLREVLPKSRLLFIAHREEILNQARDCFRQVLKDASFGEFMYGGRSPKDGQHIFASIQSLSRRALTSMPADYYDVVIVDEFHHAAAPTYAEVLRRVRPRELVGLTATPERTDEQDILRYFDGRIAAELRLWEAIDYGYLCPFQYFGIADGTDVSAVHFTRGRYDLTELSRVYTGNDSRVGIVLTAIKRIVANPLDMRAFGFCVSVDHARFMADRFTRAGIPSTAVLGTTPEIERRDALRKLKDREVNCVFSVDVFNEGVDVPQVDTVLLLRPTESATVFLQQLGRGLRRVAGKTGLTVLDFIGQQNRQFSFAPRIAALTGRPRYQLTADVDHEFPFVPSGCHVELHRVSRSLVLANLAQQVQGRRTQLVEDLRAVGDVSLSTFIRDTARTLDDVYRAGGWISLRRDAGFEAPPARADDEAFIRGVNRLRHADDPERISTYRAWVGSPTQPDLSRLTTRARRLLEMLLAGLTPRSHRASLADALGAVWARPAVLAEMLAALDVIEQMALDYPRESVLGDDVPLVLHARYTRSEALIALGDADLTTPAVREGVRSLRKLRLDAFFVTLDKTGSSFSPTTRYRDYPISPREFHWESQSTTTLASPTGQRYIGARDPGWRFLLFARESPDLPGGRTAPFLFLGPVTHLAHESERPIKVTWRLEQPMPIEFFEAAKTVA